MELKTVESPVEKSADFKTSKFSIGDSKLIAHILRSKMYRHPIMTICREVTANARDAHKEVGTPEKPIEIKLPSVLDNSFYIRDFGPGISPDRMENVFIRYGVSTKRETNEQIGGFGLGAKSPFAYADTFTVVTTTPDGKDDKHPNTKRTYVAYVENNDEGSMSLISEESTSDPCGTKIQLAIKEGDMEEFKRCIAEASMKWDVKPTIYGDITYREEKIIFSDPNGDWELKQKTYDSKQNDHITVYIDGYPYDASKLYHEATYKITADCGLSYYERICRHYGVNIFCKTGIFSVTANREEIEVNEDNITALAKIINKIDTEAVDIIKEQIANYPTYKKAAKALYELSNSCTYLREEKFFWNNKEISGNISYPSDIIITNCRYRYDGKRLDETAIWKVNASYFDDTFIEMDIDKPYLKRDLIKYILNTYSKGSESNNSSVYLHSTNMHYFVKKAEKKAKVNADGTEEKPEEVKIPYDWTIINKVKASEILEEFKEWRKSNRKKPVNSGGRVTSPAKYFDGDKWRPDIEYDFTDSEDVYVHLHYTQPYYMRGEEKVEISNMDFTYDRIKDFLRRDGKSLIGVNKKDAKLIPDSMIDLYTYIDDLYEDLIEEHPEILTHNQDYADKVKSIIDDNRLYFFIKKESDGSQTSILDEEEDIINPVLTEYLKKRPSHGTIITYNNLRMLLKKEHTPEDGATDFSYDDITQKIADYYPILKMLKDHSTYYTLGSEYNSNNKDIMDDLASYVNTKFKERMETKNASN